MSIVVVSQEDLVPVATKTEAPAPESTEDTKQSASTPQESDETAEASDTSETLEENADDQKADEVEESEGEEESQSKDEDKKAKESKGIKKKFQKFSKQLSTMKQENEYLRSLLEKGKDQSGPAHQEKIETKSTEGKPQEADFETHADYFQAMTEWTIDQREQKKESQAKETQAKTAYQSQVDSFKAKSMELAKKSEEYVEAVEDVSDIPMSIAIEELLLESQNPELLFEIAKDRELYEKLNKLSPLAAAKEIGKIELKLSTPSKEEKVIKTKAPAPITPVNSKSGSLKKSIYDQDLSQGEYEALRAKQEAAKRARMAI
jgi:hypothetical protein